MNDFLSKALDDFLHKNPEVAKEMLKRIQQSERERKEIPDVKKLANQRAKAANIHNEQRLPLSPQRKGHGRRPDE